MTLRTATEADIPAIMKILEAGRGIMLASGNLNQWPQGYPTEAMVRRDIGSGYGKVMEEEGRQVAYFACIPSPYPTYAVIYDGAWEDDEKPYYVVHRIASFPQVHGVFKTMMEYLDALTDNIRIDRVDICIGKAADLPRRAQGKPAAFRIGGNRAVF